jgi:hypothetical protein
MGIAAYNRGSLSISRQFCAESGCRGCVRCREYKPTPRPPTWGDKASARAKTRAQRIVAGCARYGLPRPSVELLSDAVQKIERVGVKTARAAAESALQLDDVNRTR